MSLEGPQFGEFTILERIGQGGMGAVYKAAQTSLDRLVALKTLQSSFAQDAEYIGRFRQEARAAARLSHPNLVQVYSAGETDGLHWFAMEYIEGESAHARLKRKGRLDPLEAVAIALHVATALEYGWERAQLIHRDIKPDNIFLSEHGEVKLGDLGLAKSAGQTQSLTMTGTSMGTPYYVSPEQAQGMKSVDLRADIYSLGCTLYHLLSGQPPYQGENPVAIMLHHVTSPVPNLRAVWPECPEELAKVVMKMMLKPPESRPQSYGEVIGELRRVYDVMSGQSVPEAIAVTQPAAVGRKPAVAKASGGKTPQTATPAKSKAPLYAGLGLGAVVLAVAAFFVFSPKEEKLTTAQQYAREHSGEPNPPPAGTPGSAGTTKSAGAPGGSLLAKATKDRGGGGESWLKDVGRDTPFVNSLGMKFVPVPIVSGPTAGQKVLFGVWDVRVVDYAAYAVANPKVDGSWKAQNKDGVPCGRELDHPVVGVSWEDAQAFCQWLTDKEQAEGKLPKGLKYRLPSDEEWSWAVGMPPELGTTPAERAGKNSVDFPWGKDYPPTKKVGNYADESFHAKFPLKKNEKENRMDNQWIEGYNDGYATASPVGSFPANAYGLYDMGGNVWQWCEDWFDASHKDRVLRGASWNYGDRLSLLSSHRNRLVPGYRYYISGFRCVVGGSAR